MRSSPIAPLTCCSIRPGITQLAVIAMIASWVIPGRMLQQVNGAIGELASES